MKKIFIVAGEASGDVHGANLIREILRQSHEKPEIHAIGGENIRATGALSFQDIAHFHVTGISAAIRRIPEYTRAAKILLSDIQSVRPDIIVLIDNPGFNLYIAEQVHKLGIPVVYYISPQLWAWAPKRIEKIKRFVRKMLVVFDFEKKLYETNGVDVAFVGHPLKEELEREKKQAEGFVITDRPHVVLMPGSRRHEVGTLLPIMAQACAKIAVRYPKATFTVIQSSAIKRSLYDRSLSRLGIRFHLVPEGRYRYMSDADLAIACSGTATLELAVLGTPMIITNKGSLLTYITAKTLVRVPYLGLPNIIFGTAIVPELLQYDATPEKIARQAIHLIADQEARQIMKNHLKMVADKLGSGGASRRAAEEILNLLK